MTLDLLTIGRVGVDLYPLQTGPLKAVRTFEKFLGGTATNVAVAAARLGRATAVLTKVGPDGFGAYWRGPRRGVDGLLRLFQSRWMPAKPAAPSGVPQRMGRPSE